MDESVDEFIDASSDTGSNDGWSELCKSDYAKVIFYELSQQAGSVSCKFQITDNVHEDPCDFVGLFKVGHDGDCLASKTLSQTECEEDGKLIKCIFTSEELPEIQNGFYQFLYVTRDKEVCGASMPFEIKRERAMGKIKDGAMGGDIFTEKTEDDFLMVHTNNALKEDENLIIHEDSQALSESQSLHQQFNMATYIKPPVDVKDESEKIIQHDFYSELVMEENAQRKERIEHLEKYVELLEQENKLMIVDRKKLREDNDSLQTHIQLLQEEVKVLNQSILKSKVGNQMLASNYEVLLQERYSLKSELLDTQNLLLEKIVALKKRSDTESENRLVLAKIQEKEDIIKNLQTSIEDISDKNRSKLSSLQEKLQESNKKYQQIMAEKVELSKLNNDLTLKAVKLEKLLMAVQSEVTVLSSSGIGKEFKLYCKDLEDCKQQLVERLSDSTFMIKALEDSKELALRELNDLTQTLNQHTQAFDALKKENANVVERMKKQIYELKCESLSLRVTLEDAKFFHDENKKQKLCTYTIDGTNRFVHPWYNCYTCDIVGNYGICKVCAEVCHKGHKLGSERVSSFYCDCGDRSSFSCKALLKAIPAIKHISSQNSVPIENCSSQLFERIDDSTIAQKSSALNSSFIELKETVVNMKSRCDDLQACLEDKDAIIPEMSDKICNMEAKCKDWLEEVESLKIVAGLQSNFAEGSEESNEGQPDLPKDAATLKLHCLQLQSSLEDKELTIFKLSDQIGDLESKCMIWSDQIEDLKSHCQELNTSIKEKESYIAEMKQECVKKDAVINYLEKEKETMISKGLEFAKKQQSCEDSLLDSNARLAEAKKLYENQYMTIRKLEKKLKKFKLECTEDQLPKKPKTVINDLMNGPREVCSRAINLDFIRHVSDSDTGEHVLGVKALKIEESTPLNASSTPSIQTDSDAASLSGNNAETDSVCSASHSEESFDVVPVPSGSAKEYVTIYARMHNLDVSYESNPMYTVGQDNNPFGEKLYTCTLHLGDKTFHSSPSKSNEEAAEGAASLAAEDIRNTTAFYVYSPRDATNASSSRTGGEARSDEASCKKQLPSLQKMILMSLNERKNFKSSYESRQLLCGQKPSSEGYVACIECGQHVTLSNNDSMQPLVDHIEDEHKLRLCPVCAQPFSTSLPEKFFHLHVDAHFSKE